MQTAQIVEYLDNPQQATEWLRGLGVENGKHAHAQLAAMADAGITVDLLAEIGRQLNENLPKISDADMALENLARYVQAARNPLSIGSLFERDRAALPIMLQIFSTSQHLSDLLVRDPEGYDLLRLTEGQPVARNVLIEEICSEAIAQSDDHVVMAILRRYKHRETLRIAYGDIIGGQNIDTITRQISFLADAVCAAALQAARRKLESKRGVPRGIDGQPARFVVLGMGRLGGTELNYSSDLELIFLYNQDGKTDGDRSMENREFFQRLSDEFIRLLSEATELGVGYQVDLNLRPGGKSGALVNSVESALQYYDVKGRTWERQAFVKARPIAGDVDLGAQFLDQLQPWVYGRYLGHAEIADIKALKRRIERRAKSEGGDGRNVKTGHGGIRDVEFVIQFLQILNGGDLAEIRTGNTLDAIARLEGVGCLTFQERTILEENYAFLRRIENRLQIMFDLETHTLPAGDVELRKLAIRLNYVDSKDASALEQFKRDLNERTKLNRKIIDHLLNDAFGDDKAAEEFDLVFDPHPAEDFVRQVLAKYRFQNVPLAYEHLLSLAHERIAFLSTRRCRHFLASIAPRLLSAIADTPDPDATLANLSRVSDSLGGKGVLWELFSFNPPSLNLYVRLCASSPYLSGILTSNPGMLDELMDSLVLNKLPTFASLESTLADLCRGAEDIAPMVHYFKNSQHLRVGVRDILGKEDVRESHAALSDIAEVCLQRIARVEYQHLVERYGEPQHRELTGGGKDRAPCELILLAMGKLGGREPNYHSDLDVVFLYESDGTTRHRRPDRSTTNQYFFNQLAERIVKVVTQLGSYGRLYELDPRRRPKARSEELALSLDEFEQYFAVVPAHLWERQALCKARAIAGSAAAREKTMQVVGDAIAALEWKSECADEIYATRRELEKTATPRNLKRAIGGTMDVEFVVQMLQLKHVAESPGILRQGTLDAIDALREAGHLGADDAEFFAESYRCLRRVEAGLRLMNTTALHDLPQTNDELKKLAFLLGYDDAQQIVQATKKYTTENRARFDRLFKSAAVVV